MSLIHVKKNYQITIPSPLRNALKINEGDLMEAEIQGDSIILTPKAIVDRIEEKRQEWISSLMKTGKEHPIDISEEEIIRESKEIRRRLYQEKYGKK